MTQDVTAGQEADSGEIVAEGIGTIGYGAGPG